MPPDCYQNACMIKNKLLLQATEYLMKGLRWGGYYLIGILRKPCSWPHGENTGWGDCRQEGRLGNTAEVIGIFRFSQARPQVGAEVQTPSSDS